MLGVAVAVANRKGTGGAKVATKKILYTDFEQRKDRLARGQTSQCCCTHPQLLKSFVFFELLWNTVLVLVLYYSLRDRYETVKECKYEIIYPTWVAAIYFAIVAVRSFLILPLMCLMEDGGVRVHYSVRKLFTCIDMLAVPFFTVFSFVLNNDKGMLDKCTNKFEFYNPVTTYISINYHLIGVYGLCLSFLVLISCCGILCHKAENQMDKVAAFDREDIEEMDMGPGQLRKKRVKAPPAPSFLERVQKVDEDRRIKAAMENEPQRRGSAKSIQNSISGKMSAILLGKKKEVEDAIELAKQNDKCSICMEKFSQDKEICELDCAATHIFHSDCISGWFNSQDEQTCPLCRAPL